MKFGERAQMQYAKRGGAAWAATTLAGFVGWLVGVNNLTAGRAVNAIALFATLTFLPAVLLGAISTRVVYWVATAAVGVLSLRVVQLTAEHVHQSRPGSTLDFVNAGFELLLIPVFGVGIAVVGVGLALLRRPVRVQSSAIGTTRATGVSIGPSGRK